LDILTGGESSRREKGNPATMTISPSPGSLGGARVEKGDVKIIVWENRPAEIIVSFAPLNADEISLYF